MELLIRRATARSLIVFLFALDLHSPVVTAFVCGSGYYVRQAEQTQVTLGKAPQGDMGLRPLEPGARIQREIRRGQADFYRIALASRQYLHLVVDQQGVDLVVTLLGPQGNVATTVNSLRGMLVPEHLLFVTEAPGDYRLEVRPRYPDSNAGRYEVRVLELRDATDEDISRVAADLAFREAEQLRMEATTEALRNAIKKYEAALSIWQDLGERSRQGEALHCIGLAYNSMGMNQRAIESFNGARSSMRDLSDYRGEAYVLADTGWCYHLLGEKEKAIQCYEEALALLRVAGELAVEALTLNRLGIVYTEAGEHHRALDLHTQALPLMRSASNRTGEAYTLAHIGWIHYFLEENQKALESHGRALSLIRTTDDRGGEAYMLANLGAVYHQMGDVQKALDYYDEALQIARSMGNKDGLAKLLYKVARVRRDQGDLSEARTQIEAALAVIESIRADIDIQELRTSYFATIQAYYELYIELLMSLHKRRPADGLDVAAMEASERARARTLLELLAEAQVDIRRDIPPALIERERSLQRLLNARAESQRRLLASKQPPGQADRMAKEIDELTTDLQEVRGRIRASSPRYAALTQQQPLSLKEIQQQVLDADTMLLKYSLGDKRSYLWAVTRSSVASHELAKRADIEAAARHVYELATARRAIAGETDKERLRRIAKADSEYQSAAMRLSSMLLGPVLSQLGARRLLIVADGVLQFVPFAALPVSATVRNRSTQAQGEATTGGRSAVPLMLDHEIVSLPSASALAVLRRSTEGRKCPGKLIAVLADPVFDVNDPRVKLRDKAKEASVVEKTRPAELEKAVRDVEPIDGRGTLSRLPFSREEAEGIMAVAPLGQGFKAIDFTASRVTAESPELNRYCIVHFATHGLLNSKHPELSGIVLSLVDERGRAQDGFFRLHEVYNLNLTAELVVLSACQTALGKEIKGEGLVGLTRGFMYAGARRVMASLWKVNDSATAELMTSFYRAIFTKGLQPAAALRAAQIEMWKKRRWQSPYYWAAFVIQGEYR
jgi:CHAT domain-containing protein/tetratricopeptide (TPR) repeat protein